MAEVLRELVRVSEKAADIARACRQQDTLFQLLVEEKKDGDKNKKFVNDFKTLADVLVQEVIKHHLGQKFPGLEEHVAGEESNEFTNELGERITVGVRPTEAETRQLLSKVLDGHDLAAAALARAVHREPAPADPALEALTVAVPLDSLGVWVDPIDSTYQYIQGSVEVEPVAGVFPRGLQCVTILIGVFDRLSGEPLMGVINQPFAEREPGTGRWSGRCCWGLSYLGTNVHSLPPAPGGPEDAPGRPASAVVSSSEKEEVRAALGRACGGGVRQAAGAGYKSLCVVRGLADFYVFSEDTTFKWDSCAGHAILRALGGGMADWRESLRPGPARAPPPLRYHEGVRGAVGVDRWANRGGLVAYRSVARLQRLLAQLRENPGLRGPAP
ncbi:inositol polyphosphate 1-phosphatase [Tachyglossus aculeatus]|uniref:inositol polyphosphate 1-phosphatase n=1 Tax=Tachyglossus aculeatus TaxID=9261 RepID=UPI0018F48F64|nr:inositol polyphosphate 1-phosphatase [Tachyglossus aculeatus]XP_038605341.1 inositol polyphosphate 1-phosphatase [Tachyglossus aculeatus]